MQMQTPKTSTKSSSEGPLKISPRSASSDATQRGSGRTARQLKTTGLEPNSSSPNKTSIRTPKTTSPIISARRSPKSPISELQQKRPGRVAELETQISQLQDALITVKNQLVSSESWKDQAQQDAEESRKQLLAVSSKLEESQKLLTISSSDKPHINELEEIQDLCEAGDEEWKTKLEAAKKLHAADLDALAAAMNEIGQLQVQLAGKAESEAAQTNQAESAYAEVHNLKETVAKTLSLVETMKNQLQDCRSSESQAQALARETSLELETAKKIIESLKLVGKDNDAIGLESESENRDEEIYALKSEVGKLKSDVETAETRFNEEQSRRKMEITSAYELVEEIKFNSRVKESELEGELKKSKAVIEELKANLMDKETELQGICEENDDLNSKLKNSFSGRRENELENEIKSLKEDFNSLESKLMVTETELHKKSDENEKLKLEIMKTDCKELLASENESIIKVDHLVEEIEKSNKKVARVVAELEAAQAANCKTEAELRRLKVQSDQWRKAAEAAAAMLSSANQTNQKMVMRTGSMEAERNIGSPYGEEIDGDDDEFLKKKNGNVLKRIGVLWKKPQHKRT
ncbi:interactor of constitutive active ROPs 3-like isoform X2 [Cynara cardunculus var. scolymus]|uniref:interactor of constitutive active ROPs 3-like isoform X2 n=1 Tax=Cynara cardunculus var. scolymus TaxID=59895 RepID=UPI000D628A29|nr:interactor of constitutive active ROPs 3-like isoform X2 [Cynara cardunculus var. scolymus]